MENKKTNPIGSMSELYYFVNGEINKTSRLFKLLTENSCVAEVIAVKEYNADLMKLKDSINDADDNLISYLEARDDLYMDIMEKTFQLDEYGKPNPIRLHDIIE